jgi:hypothetical protein
MMHDLKIDSAAPPTEFSAPLQAMWWLKKGGFKLGAEWDKAHALCQQEEGERAHDLVHALCHWIEGDTSNRDYWYRRIKGWQRADEIAQEWRAIWQALAEAGQ